MGKVGGPADRQRWRLTRRGRLLVTVAAAVAVVAVIFRLESHTGTSAPGRTPHPSSVRVSPVRSASSAAVTWPVAGPVADLSVPLPGMPPVPDPANIYADAGAGMLSPAVRGVPYRIYVPDSGGSTVTVINPATLKVTATYRTGLNPQHVVPGYDLRTLYVTNDLGNSLTPVNPRTGRPAGPNIAVDDPYNMYFTPDGRYAIVVAEARQNLDFRDPHTFALRHRIHVNCAGVDHIDFAASGAYLIATCEFGGRLVRVDLHTLKVAGYLNLPGSAPQDIKLDPAGRIFYVADKNHGGVWLVSAATFRLAGFIP
ncbi:MAG TPA: YncE family protein, partial [Streptosporangiaceae bacterium]